MEPLKATRSDYNWVSCLLLGILADPLREAIMIIMRDAAPPAGRLNVTFPAPGGKLAIVMRLMNHCAEGLTPPHMHEAHSMQHCVAL